MADEDVGQVERGADVEAVVVEVAVLETPLRMLQIFAVVPSRLMGLQSFASISCMGRMVISHSWRFSASNSSSDSRGFATAGSSAGRHHPSLDPVGPDEDVDVVEVVHAELEESP